MTARAAPAAWASSVSNPVKRATSPADLSRGESIHSGGGNGDYALEDLCLRSGRCDRRGHRHGDHFSITQGPRDAHGRRRDRGHHGPEHGSVPDRARRRRSAEERPASASVSVDAAAGFDSGHHVLFGRLFTFSHPGSVQSIRVRSRAQRRQLVLEPVLHAFRGAVQGFGQRREPDPSSGDRVAACGKEVERALVAGVGRLQQRNLLADPEPGRDEVGVRESQLSRDLPNLGLLDSGHLVVGS